MLQQHDHPLSEPHLGPADGPHRSPCGGAAGRGGSEADEKLSSDRLGEPSTLIRERVERARERQRLRFKGTRLYTNADMGPKEVRLYCKLDEAGNALIKAATRQLGLSTRAFHRILKVSRTIADLAGSEAIETTHLAEALQYRPRRQV